MKPLIARYGKNKSHLMKMLNSVNDWPNSCKAACGADMGCASVRNYSYLNKAKTLECKKCKAILAK